MILVWMVPLACGGLCQSATASIPREKGLSSGFPEGFHRQQLEEKIQELFEIRVLVEVSKRQTQAFLVMNRKQSWVRDRRHKS